LLYIIHDQRSLLVCNFVQSLPHLFSILNNLLWQTSPLPRLVRFLRLLPPPLS
jgi:hypothetical protein